MNKSKAYKQSTSSPAKKGGKAKMHLTESHKWFNGKRTFPMSLRGKWVSVANKKIIESAESLSELIKKTKMAKQEFFVAKIPISKNACCGLRFLK